MTRSTFGGTSLDRIVDPYEFGQRQLLELRTGQTTLKFYTAQVAGTRYTDLLDQNGQAAAAITVDGSQIPKFQGPDSVVGMWVDKGDGSPREFMGANDALAIAGAVSQAQAAAAAAQGAAGGNQVRYDTPQSLTTPQKAQARANIDAPLAADVSALQQLVGTDGRVKLAKLGLQATVASLGVPLYIAHRGGANVHPENMLEGFLAGAGLPGGVLLENDTYLTRDGSLVVMHDSTIDRTTSGSGNTADQTSGSIRALQGDPTAWFLSGYPAARVPTLQDLLREFGGKVILVPEAKNTGAAQAIVDAVTAAGLTRSVIVQASVVADANLIAAAGIDTLMLSTTANGTDLNPTSLAAAGVKYIGVPSNPDALSSPTSYTNSTQITQCHSLGIKVICWTVDRRVERDRLLALGVDGFFSNDPWYLSGAAPRLSSDPFASRSYYHGHLPGNNNPTKINVPRGDFSVAGGLTIDAYTTPGISGFVLQGWGCPIKGSANANTFQIDLTLNVVATEGSGNWGSVFFCATDDRSFDDAAATGVNGYHVLFRQTGVIDLYKVTAGVATNIGTVTTPTAQGAGVSRAYRIVVSPTQVVVSAPSLGAPNSLTVTDSTYRGGYFHLGCRDSKYTFSGVAIS